MEKEFVNYNQALKLKALGFDEPCLAGYIRFRGSGSFELAFYKYRNVDFNTTSNIYVSAPLYQQAFRWFREKYQLEGEISKRYRWSANSPNPEETFYQWGIFDFTKGRKNYIIWLSGYDADKGEKACTSYEESELACLDKLIELTLKSE